MFLKCSAGGGVFLAVGGCGVGGFGNLMDPSEGMNLCSMSQSMAFFEAYCFASFFLLNVMESQVNGSGVSPMVTEHVKRPLTMDSSNARPALALGWAARYSNGRY